jgi:aspartokinase-like uncharacterized kinase
MNDLEKYAQTLADANHTMAIMCKQILIMALADRDSLEGLFDLVDDWHQHLKRLAVLISSYEQMMEKLVL